MIVHMMLCDHAQVADGKLFIHGGGISRVQGSGLPPATCIALLMLVPWDQTNQPIDLSLQLLTEDGQQVTDQNGESRVFTVQVEVGRPPGVEPGIDIDVPMALQVGGVFLQPGRYTWQLHVNGRTEQAWQVRFSVVKG